MVLYFPPELVVHILSPGKTQYFKCQFAKQNAFPTQIIRHLHPSAIFLFPFPLCVISNLVNRKQSMTAASCTKGGEEKFRNENKKSFKFFYHDIVFVVTCLMESSKSITLCYLFHNYVVNWIYFSAINRITSFTKRKTNTNTHTSIMYFFSPDHRIVIYSLNCQSITILSFHSHPSKFIPLFYI